ncbi:MAG TPA: hypothetical protein VGM50_22920 [Gemmatimonadaceae bacterium]|jgi:DNA-binding GntR family transcriptional regulator
MSFPAYDQLPNEIGRGFATWRVYMHLMKRLDFLAPKEVKVWALAEDLQMSRRKVRSALDWLVDRGYLIAHDRGTRGVRAVRLAYNVQKPERPAA